MLERVQQQGPEINAADIEHIGAMVAGGLMLLTGLRKGGLAGLIFKAGGTALLLRGKTGYRRLYDALGVQLPMTPTGVGRYNVRVESAVNVNRRPSEVYRIWRNLENLPVFMDDLVAVYEIDDVTSRWVARGPAGTVVKWDANIINDVENELIAWESLEGSGVDNAGSVHFEETPEGGTHVRVVLRYDPPAEQLGTALAKLFRRDPQTQIDRDLRRFKRIMDVGGSISEASPAQAQLI